MTFCASQPSRAVCSDNAHQAFWGVYFGTADTDKAVDLATSHGGHLGFLARHRPRFCITCSA